MAKAVFDKLEDWILVGLKLGHPLPVIAQIVAKSLRSKTR